MALVRSMINYKLEEVLKSRPEKRGLKAYEDEKIIEEYRRSDRPQLFIDTAGNIFEATYN